MGLRTFTKIPSGDRVLDQVQEGVAQALNPLASNPSNDKTLLASVNLAVGLNLVAHTLGRKLTGWTVVRQRAQAQLWDSQDSASAPEKFLYLNASVAVTVDLEVF